MTSLLRRVVSDSHAHEPRTFTILCSLFTFRKRFCERFACCEKTVEYRTISSENVRGIHLMFVEVGSSCRIQGREPVQQHRLLRGCTVVNCRQRCGRCSRHLAHQTIATRPTSFVVGDAGLGLTGGYDPWRQQQAASEPCHVVP